MFIQTNKKQTANINLCGSHQKSHERQISRRQLQVQENVTRKVLLVARLESP